MKKIIVLLFLLVVLTGIGAYVYQMHMNHNFETVTEGKVYKSGVIPPDQIADYVKKYLFYTFYPFSGIYKRF
jgi:hypothetical protein